MNPTLARLLTRLYPPAWRDRYGVEFEAFLQTGQGGLRTSVNVVWSALWNTSSQPREATWIQIPIPFAPS